MKDLYNERFKTPNKDIEEISKLFIVERTVAASLGNLDTNIKRVGLDS